MEDLKFNKQKAKSLFDEHRRKTGLSLSKLSLKLGKGSSYLSSVLAENRPHLPKEEMVLSIAKLLKVRPELLCDGGACQTEPDSRPRETEEEPLIEVRDCDVFIKIKLSTFNNFKAAIESVEKKPLEIVSTQPRSLQRIRALLEEALAALA